MGRLSAVLIWPCLAAIALVTTAQSSARAIQPPCQTEVYSGSGVCYWLVTTTRKRWPDALASCEAEGGTLAMTYKQGINDFIVNSLTLTEFTWLGATDSETEGEWVWVDGRPVSWTNWDLESGEPNGGTDLSYMMITSPSFPNGPGLWHDAKNTGHRHYLCQTLPAPPVEMSVTCDDIILELSLDGDVQTVPDSNVTTWNCPNMASNYTIPAGTQVIRVECYNIGGLGGLLASFSNGDMTDGSWQCSAEGGDMAPANVFGANGGTVAEISPEANWIWTTVSGAQRVSCEKTITWYM